MKIVIISDSHVNLGIIKRIVKREEPFDLLFHLGDGIEEAGRLQKIIGYNLDGVEGNNDIKGVYPTSLVLEFGSKRCLFTHGHLFDVHRDLSLLVADARRSRADLVFFGHTHRYYDSSEKGIRLINPGSVCSHLSNDAGYLVVKIEKRDYNIEKISNIE